MQDSRQGDSRAGDPKAQHTRDPSGTESDSAQDTQPIEDDGRRDFDFLFGNWNIINRRLVERLSGSDEWIEFGATLEIRPILNGLGNMDCYRAIVGDKPFEGMSLRLFNPETRLWSIYWADSWTPVL